MSMLSTVRTLDLKHFENVKTAFEHVSLYVGLVVYTAAGAKVVDCPSFYLVPVPVGFSSAVYHGGS